jgi:hypothetical protein
VAGARDSFTYQITDMPLLSTFYAPLSKQLISVLAVAVLHERIEQLGITGRLRRLASRLEETLSPQLLHVFLGQGLRLLQEQRPWRWP